MSKYINKFINNDIWMNIYHEDNVNT